MRSSQEAASLLENINESLSVDPDKLARVAGQFITPTEAKSTPFG